MYTYDPCIWRWIRLNFGLPLQSYDAHGIKSCVAYHFEVDGFIRLKADDQLISEGVQV